MAHLLIVDDERPGRTTLALLLRKRGHHVVEADGLAAVVKRLGEEIFDLVVTDLKMPDGDGLEVLRTVKAQAPQTEVILLTAYAGWRSAKEAIRLGALDYFERGTTPRSSTTASTRRWPSGRCGVRTRTCVASCGNGTASPA